MPPDARWRSLHANEDEKLFGLWFQPSANSSHQMGLARARVPKDRKRGREASGRDI